jgi:hypothetical protein
VGKVSAPLGLELTSVPPVVMLDAIWLTVLTDTSQTNTDRLGRQRMVKTRHKVCVLVALGLYPQSQRWGILGWEVADSESQAAWERLLLSLEQRGLFRERGLELFIHDGGSGLIAALTLLYPHLPHQRCLFHKLRNLWHAIHPPAPLARADAHAFKGDLLQQGATVLPPALTPPLASATPLVTSGPSASLPSSTSSAVTGRTPSPLFASSHAFPTGRVPVYAPPVYSNALIAPFVPTLVTHRLITRPLAFLPLSLVCLLPSA